ncbi:hypothetical protein ACTJLC_18040 [Paraburkholderia sp. 22099]|uniref:hypothetical protein n=1 Tax=Paraburkholderia sp. 22099 TaxID=3453875 RepID=UPI003F830217
MADTQVSGEPTLHDLLTLAVKKSEGMRFSSQPVGLIEALKSPDLNTWFEAGEAIRALWTDLAETVVKDGSFLGDAVRMINTGSGAMGFYPSFLGQQLVIQAVRAGSADGATAWLKKILETNDATGKTIQTLWGECQLPRHSTSPPT